MRDARPPLHACVASSLRMDLQPKELVVCIGIDRLFEDGDPVLGEGVFDDFTTSRPQLFRVWIRTQRTLRMQRMPGCGRFSTST